MDSYSIVLTLIATGAIGATFGVILAIASVKLRVDVDPRLDSISDVLPGANCGGCGYPGCSGYAAAVVVSGISIDLCAPGGTETAQEIAKIMGQTVEAKERMIAVCHCQGRSNAG